MLLKINTMLNFSPDLNFCCFHYQNPMYDTCLGNPYKYGEICESKKDEGVVCVKDQGNTNTFKNYKKMSLICVCLTKVSDML